MEEDEIDVEEVSTTGSSDTARFEDNFSLYRSLHLVFVLPQAQARSAHGHRTQLCGV